MARVAFSSFIASGCGVKASSAGSDGNANAESFEQLNRFLIGESAPELEGFLCAGDRAQLEGIRFVLTLDADTQLPRDTARRMVETMAHPLNQARLSPDGRR